MEVLSEFLTDTGFALMTYQHAIMIAIGIVFICLAIIKDYEPLLLVPIGFGAIVGNIPSSETMLLGVYDPGSVLYYLYFGVSKGIYPPLIFLGIGAQEGVRMGIEGEDLENSVSAVDFLKKISKGQKPYVGKKVAVIGGGFTAIDSARSALRLGAEEVFILYRRTREEMPSSDEEISDAESEGVKIMYLVCPQEIIGNGKVEKIRMLNYVLGDPDDSNRRRPVEVPGTEFSLDIDLVIGAVSQSVNIETGQDLTLTRWKTLDVDEATGQTNIGGVYAGGDCAQGPQNVISAIADGKKSATAIDQFLSGDDSFLVDDAEKVMADKDKVLQRVGDKSRAWRPQLDEVDPTRRIKDFEQHITDLTMAQAVAEAQRCLACGCGAGCEICKDICKMFAWSMDAQGRVELDQDKCSACGMCIWRCPSDNIEMIQTGTENLVN